MSMSSVLESSGQRPGKNWIIRRLVDERLYARVRLLVLNGGEPSMDSFVKLRDSFVFDSNHFLALSFLRTSCGRCARSSSRERHLFILSVFARDLNKYVQINTSYNGRTSS